MNIRLLNAFKQKLKKDKQKPEIVFINNKHNLGEKALQILTSMPILDRFDVDIVMIIVDTYCANYKLK